MGGPLATLCSVVQDVRAADMEKVELKISI